MRFKHFYSLCCNLTLDSRLSIYEEGHEGCEPIMVTVRDVYYDIYDREIKWFSFEKDLVVIKLKEEKDVPVIKLKEENYKC